MQRRRDIAASPIRDAHDTWDVIKDLVVATLDRSPHVAGESVRAELVKADAAAIALIAGGHLGREPLTVVAADLRLDVYAIEGRAAFIAHENENLNAVPGAATAQDWIVYLPRPELLGALVDPAVEDAGHVVSGPAPAEIAQSSKASSAPIDLRRLDPTARR